MSTQETLHIIAAVIIYRDKGVIEAIKYLTENGYSDTEAISLLELVDNMTDAVRDGRLN